MLIFLYALWASSLFIVVTLAQDYWNPEQNTKCDCFKTASNAIYQNQILVDFRHGKPANFDSFFRPLEAPSYQAGKTINQMSKSQVSFVGDHLTLLANVKNGQQYSASIESIDTVHYGSFRARYAIRAGGAGGGGAVSGFFTYKSGGSNELDIEILTSDSKNTAHYSTHIAGREGGGNPYFEGNLGTTWDEMRTHRFDWEDDVVKFWVNTKAMGDLRQGVPQSPSILCLNMWSSGEPTWGGSMKEGGEARMKVEFVQGFYNGTDGGRGCKKVCYVG